MGNPRLRDPFEAPLRLSLGLASIASCLQERLKARCRIYCGTDYSPGTLARYIRRERPSVIGISCQSFNRFACVELARLVKEVDPAVTVIMGGIHATFLDGQILSSYPCVDYVVRGEGEDSFEALLRALDAGRDLSSVAGITFRSGGKPHRSASRPSLTGLDELPLIDLKAFPVKPLKDPDAAILMHDGIPVETHRGCPFACRFCSTVGLWQRKVSEKNIDQVIAQLYLIPEGCRDFVYFHDMNFTLNREYALRLCSAIIRERFCFSWVCTTRVDLVDEELLLGMKKAGCRGIFFGLDSLSRRILRSSGKNYAPGLAIRNLALVASTGIRPCVHLMIGFPGETEVTLKESFQNLKRLPASCVVDVSPLYIMPGSPLYQQALEEGFDESYWLSDHEEAIPSYMAAIKGRSMEHWLRAFRSAGREYFSSGNGQ